jgi:bacterioferritin
MKGDAKVVEQLNAALSAELSAIAQYVVQAEMCQKWGYGKLGGLIKMRAVEEMRHAGGLIARLLLLEAVPQVSVPLQPRFAADVKKNLEIDLKDEIETISQYKDAVMLCSAAGDAESRDLFEHMVIEEVQHADFLEWQLRSMQELGMDSYRAQQAKAE